VSIGFVAKSSEPTGYFSTNEFTIPAYADANSLKQLRCQGFSRDGGSVRDTRINLETSITGAVTRLDFSINGGYSFAAGSRIIVIGEGT
jgi:hypothetical protein